MSFILCSSWFVVFILFFLLKKGNILKTYEDEDIHVNSIHNSNSSHFVSMLLIRCYKNLVTSMKRKKNVCCFLFSLETQTQLG